MEKIDPPGMKFLTAGIAWYTRPVHFRKWAIVKYMIVSNRVFIQPALTLVNDAYRTRTRDGAHHCCRNVV
jgi:hypothetical protein